MIRKLASLLLVALLLAVALYAGGIAESAAPLVMLALVVAVLNRGVLRLPIAPLPQRPALLALVSSHRLPRASHRLRHR